MKFIPANLGAAVKSPSFIEKSLLLLGTAGLTGLLVPEISSRMAVDRGREQLVFQTELARQDKILDAQAAYYDRFAELIWEFQLLHVEVSFRRFLHDPAKYQEAVNRYTSRASELLGRLRAEISKGRRLMGTNGYQTLLDLYQNELLPRDAKLENLIQKPDDGSLKQWHEHHAIMMGSFVLAIDSALDSLAKEMNLSAPERKK